MSGIPAKVEEGTNLVLDEEEIALAEGWSSKPSGSSVDRIGETVIVSLQVRYLAKAAALVATLPVEYRPAASYTTGDGKFTIATNGEVTSNETKTELETALVEGKYLTCHASYRAAVQNP
jgi:hypothetical protein